ncbi:hypothetical protein OnM2_001035 [Erysiphe neolycopersici]|uniref:Uncharacterized protein n=1 Tax=Erysiphe neolycopersici TaxID=212602 RepID=A0A420I8I1_9PEZI|nr:hypothetical protein OnM2_001035 [Erysiphe neolycopersici]
MSRQTSAFRPLIPLKLKDKNRQADPVPDVTARLNVNPIYYTILGNTGHETIKDLLLACALSSTSETGTLF